MRSANPVVAETNDGFLNNIRARPITEADVLNAIRAAAEGPVAEGAVGAGRGTVAFGWKGGIGTSSRKLPAQFGGWTVGVLVQTNFGGDLRIDGVPIEIKVEGAACCAPTLKTATVRSSWSSRPMRRSITCVSTRLANRALDRPRAHRQLDEQRQRRLRHRFLDARASSAFARPRPPDRFRSRSSATMSCPDSSRPSIDATEEAIDNSLLRAETVRGYRGAVRALPVDSTDHDPQTLRSHPAMTRRSRPPTCSTSRHQPRLRFPPRPSAVRRPAMTSIDLGRRRARLSDAVRSRQTRAFARSKTERRTTRRTKAFSSCGRPRRRSCPCSRAADR